MGVLTSLHGVVMVSAGPLLASPLLPPSSSLPHADHRRNRCDELVCPLLPPAHVISFPCKIKHVDLLQKTSPPPKKKTLSRQSFCAGLSSPSTAALCVRCCWAALPQQHLLDVRLPLGGKVAPGINPRSCCQGD